MNKKIISLTALLLCTCMLFSGCTKKGWGESFTYDLSARPKNLDPQMASDDASLTVVGNIFEGLLVKEADGDIVPGVAEKFEVNNNQTVYTFYLREDAAWGDKDQTKVTADDFLFTFERLLSPNTKSPYSESFFAIKNGESFYNGSADSFGVQVVNDHTLKIALAHPDPFFMDLLTTPAASPCNRKFFESTQGGYGLSVSTLMSNGPFRLTYWDDETDYYLVLKANPNYASSTPVVPSKVLLNVYPEYASRKQNFEKGNSSCFLYQNLLSVQMDNAKQFDNTTWSLLLNNQNQFLSYDNIREGIALATDTDVIKDILPDYYQLAGAIVPPSVTLKDTTYREFAEFSLIGTPDRKTAKEKFSKGLSDYNRDTQTQSIPKITVLCTEGDAAVNVSYLTQLWQRDLGFYVGVEIVTHEELLKRVSQKNYDIALYPISSSQNSIDNYLGVFHSANPHNVVSLHSPQIDSAINALINSKSFEDKAVLAASLEKQILATHSIIPLYYQSQFFVSAKSVRDVEYNPFLGFVKFKEAKKS